MTSALTIRHSCFTEREKGAMQCGVHVLHQVVLRVKLQSALSPWEQSGAQKLCVFLNWCDIPCKIKATLVARTCNGNVRCNCSICKHMQACLHASSAGYKVGQLPEFIFRTCTMDVWSPCHHIFTWLTSKQGTKLCFARNQLALTLEKAQRGRDWSLS